MITESLLNFMNEQAKFAGLPSVNLDYLSTSAESLSMQTIANPSIFKEYLDGTIIRKLSFALAQSGKGESTSSLKSLEILKSLSAFALLFEGMNNFILDEKFIIVSSDVGTPSIVDRENTGDIVYSVTININYKEI